MKKDANEAKESELALKKSIEKNCNTCENFDTCKGPKVTYLDPENYTDKHEIDEAFGIHDGGSSQDEDKFNPFNPNTYKY